VLIAVAVDWEGRRQILAVNLANRESPSSWKNFLLSLKNRGLHGVEFAVSDDHAGLKKAIPQVLPEAAWQRCYVHFPRNALDHLPRKANDDCLKGLRWMYDRRELSEVRHDLAGVKLSIRRHIAGQRSRPPSREPRRADQTPPLELIEGGGS
jgi:putative transposase